MTAPSTSGSRAGRLLSYVLLSAAVVSALFPLFWTVSTSIKRRVDTFAIPPRFVSFTPTWKNFTQLFNDDAFWNAYRNTAFITLVSTAISVFVGTLAAYALARHRRFTGRRTFEATLVLVRAMPGIVLMVPIYQMVTRLDLYNNRWALIMIYATINLPFAVWLMTGFASFPLCAAGTFTSSSFSFRAKLQVTMKKQSSTRRISTIGAI